jgi:cytidyltransferase-like protein
VIRQAKQLGQHLTVGVCSDRLVRLHKRAPPMCAEHERLEVVQSLKDVDEAFLYDNPNQTISIQRARAAIFAIGAEFGKQGVAEHQQALADCETQGITVRRIPRLAGISSGDIKSRIIRDFWAKRGQMTQAGQLAPLQATSLTETEEAAQLRLEREWQAIFKAILHSKRPRQRVLELGCGVGRITEQLARVYKQVDASDFVPEFIALARQRTSQRPHVRYRCEDAAEFDQTIAYDCCVIAGLFPYLNDAQVTHILSRLTAVSSLVLKESVGTWGRFELADNHRSAILRTNYTAVYRSAAELIELCGRAGFVLAHTEVIDYHRPETHLRAMLFERP